ncbi:hypothetical protein OPV22_032248 [Ensete ventricosum]|uniref:Gnk2-homologous domain-containing protein n=1 Tax=Ensete ventricosum TaxID=4639 RepID=A0AAV8PUW5_ENSVE|nr:hypothetical protein OPV22_032248 [Ensete ventricosum]
MDPLPLFLLLLLPCFAPLSYAADTISANNSLSGSQTISSTGGNFVLGFFKPGRRNLEQTEDGTSGYLPTLVASKLKSGDVGSLLDHRLGGEADLEEMERACKVACWCIQDDESCRPTMGQVVQILEGFLEVNMPPIPRSLRVLAETPEDINFFYELSSSNQSSQTRSAASGSSQTKSTASNSSGL